jgi:hypothetical protein
MLGILNPEEALKAAVFAFPPDPGFALCPEFRVGELLLLKLSLLLPLFPFTTRCTASRKSNSTAFFPAGTPLTV